ncbi:hypothetical protein CLOM_g10092, partial [Closterium sp. NIES-68]
LLFPCLSRVLDFPASLPVHSAVNLLPPQPSSPLTSPLQVTRQQQQQQQQQQAFKTAATRSRGGAAAAEAAAGAAAS